MKGFAKISWASEDSEKSLSRLELYLFDDCSNASKVRCNYTPVLEEFGGRYNKKSRTATVKASPYQVANFVRDKVAGFGEVATYIDF